MLLLVFGLGAEVGAPDHRPGADPEVVETQADEARNPALGLVARSSRR